MPLSEFLDRLQNIVSRAESEKDYIEYCMIDDTTWLLEEYNDNKK